MALLVHVCPSRLWPQRRGFFRCSALGTIDGERSSNSRSWSICFLNLVGSSGSGFSDTCNLSPISRMMARLCAGSMSMRLGITKPRSGKKAPAAKPQRPAPTYPSATFPLASTAGNSEWNRRPSLLAICACACIKNSVPLAATFGYPRHAPCKHRRARRSRIYKAWRAAFVPLISLIATRCSSRTRNPKCGVDASTRLPSDRKHAIGMKCDY